MQMKVAHRYCVKVRKEADMTVRERFCEKVNTEYTDFRERMLQREKAEIYAAAYRIDVWKNLCKILCRLSEQYPEEVLEKLLPQPNLMECLYECWLKIEDSAYEELVQLVEKEIEEFE